ncbi:Cobalt-zinc-cadmium resistance protein CzcA; Cation efflux system protein CusA [hydrothermal vent metagenome]|uniref:Cobalt-zinc-cadmium resistance protein CzcA Cation efflux system protein CusA n=1 Tax=hydrothermal vent metagenome TaxID=652676 RepID=A0A3B0TVK6_9ZZZZ
MINKIIFFSIKRKFIILTFVLAWIVWGIYSMFRVPLDAVPDITNNQVQVITTTPNLGTGDIEQFVTYPVELSMSNLPGVIELRSVSRFGLSVVTIVFEDDMGTYLPRQLVAEKLSEVKDQIPQGFGEPFMAPISTGLGEIYQYTIVPKPGYDTVYSPMELRTIQDWIVRRQMSMLPGVVEVNSFGGYQKQYEVSVDPDKMKSMDIGIMEIFDALKKNNENTGGAYIEKDKMANFIRGEGLLRNIKDIESIVITNVDGIPILIRDVANVRFGSAVRYGTFTKDGKGEAVGGIVMMLKGENSNDVIGRVKERIAEIQKSLPEGLEIKPFLNRSKLIKSTTSTVAENLSLGALIVVFFMMLLLGGVRGGLIIASVMPLSLLFAFSLMNIFGVWANLMSLGAIDFGIIIDGAVIIVESVMLMVARRFMTNSTGRITDKEMAEITYSASTQRANSVFFGLLIILIIFFPILALTGIEGKMFKPMALTTSFALIGGLILSLTYVPAVSVLFLKGKPRTKRSLSDKIMDGLIGIYEPMLRYVLKIRKVVLIAVVALLAISIYTFTKIGGEFMPKLDEGDIAFQAILKPGTSLTEVEKTSTRLQQIVLDNFPEVEQILGRIGVAEIPTDPMPMDIVDMFVILKPKDQWVSAQTKSELIEKMKEKIAVLPGINFEFTQPIEMRFNELLTGVREDVSVKLYGEDLDVLAVKAQEMAKIISTVKGTADLKVEATSGLPQMTVQYNRAKIAQYGLNIRDLNTIVRSAFSGESAGVIFEGEKRFDLVVRLEKKHKKDIESIRNLYVHLPNGNQVPLKEVAEVDYKGGPMQISRDGTKRRIYVGINVRGRDVESTVKDIQKKINAQLKLPAGYYIKYGGAFENLERAKKRLTVVVPLALVLIFILLFLALRSIKQTALIYMAIPMAAIGGIFSLYFRDINFSISAGVGFIILFGVSVMNGLILISRFNALKEEGVSNLVERITKGSKEVMRPILLAASTDIVGFIPMALSQSAGAEVQRPLATVVIGGLLTALVLTLLVIPVLYYLFETSGSSQKKTIAAPGKLTTLLLVGLLVSGLATGVKTANAQEVNKITMQQAIEIALKNNPQVKAASLGIEKQENLKKSAFDLDNTEFSYTNGQINSSVIDNSWEVSQNFKFPTTYISQAKLQSQKVALSEQLLSVSENELIRNVKAAYSLLSYGYSQLRLFVELDSIYRNFAKAAQVRYDTGESNLLEKAAAQGKYQEIKLRRQQAQADVQIYMQELQRWLNTNEPISIAEQQLNKMEIEPEQDTARLNNNPFLQYYQQLIKVSEQEYKLQKTKFLPGLSAGYFRQQIEGTPGFTGVKFGVNIPIAFWAKQGKAQAAKVDIKITRAKYENSRMRIKTLFNNQIQEYFKYKKLVDYYETQGLAIANELMKYAQKGYQIGEIDYVEYIRNIDQGIEIRTQYLDNLKQYNITVIEINFLMGNSN